MRPGPSARTVTAIALAVLSAGLFAFAVIKASLMSFSYDETWTWLMHVRKGVLFQQTDEGMRGNHHLLNVWGMMLAQRFFGDGELALRLPNLLAYAGYLYASTRIALRARTLVLALAGWILLNAHPYMIDFFCLARGYGIGCGAAMLALWSTTRFYAEGRRLKDMAWAMAWAAVAAIAHLVMMNFLLAVAAVLLISLVHWARADGVRPWRKHVVLLLSIAAIGTGVLLANAIPLFRSGPLNYGCHEFWSCSMASLGRHLLYGHHPWLTPIGLMLVATTVIAAIALLVIAYERMKGRGKSLSPAVAGSSIVILYLLGFAIQHVVFGVPYPEDRMTVFLVPLAMFVLVAFLNAFSGPRWAVGALAVLLALPVSAHWLRSFDPERSEEWRASAATRKLLSAIEADRQPIVPERPAVLVGTGFDVSGSIGYYIHSRHWHWLHVRDHPPSDSFPPCDYYIVDHASMNLVDTTHWSLLYTDGPTGQHLYRDHRYTAWRGELLHHRSSQVDKSIHDTAPLLEWTVPEETGQIPVLITGTADVLEMSDNNWLILVVDVRREGRTITHADVASHRQIGAYGQWTAINVELLMREPLLPGDVVSFAAVPMFGREQGAIFVGAMHLRVSR